MLAGLARLFRAALAAPGWIDCDGLRARLAGPTAPLVVDVRGRDEFDGPLGHIEGALNIPLPELGQRRGEIAAPERPLVFVCLTDKRSSAAAAQVSAGGRAGVFVLRGGMKAWREAG